MRHLFRSNQASLAAGQAAWDNAGLDDDPPDTRTECEIFGHKMVYDGEYHTLSGGAYSQWLCTECDHVEERKHD